MIKKMDITNPDLAEKVLNVQLPSYRVEAELIDYDDIPPLKDTVTTLQQCGETFYGYYLDGELAGVIAIKIEQGVMDIHRLIVHPNHFRKGIAKRLLHFIEGKDGVEIIKVTTGSRNSPAINFYEKNGFYSVGVIRVNQYLSLASFEKRI
ncbi:GNAT family N-acetyltransferase [Virgibacillus dakarensis]|uniref:N-acetyltransferase n=1 Tax=Lentibacillus populi TaxID=1827502 RepID=A0A9W5TWN4_9BACI|nr:MULTISPECIES: GNAT family N-acetyltransferase [Bacillaceae]MBT2218418.1 GNAT family N-acetyltransferase [Virgibacillus dakarensis]MTW87489.1 GNAT family N-acetyltransferase [Virgibacillus dakarensis]GGB35718.1 N-acetyltransferase [Lentibacillus populi]